MLSGICDLLTPGASVRGPGVQCELIHLSAAPSIPWGLQQGGRVWSTVVVTRCAGHAAAILQSSSVLVLAECPGGRSLALAV